MTELSRHKCLIYDGHASEQLPVVIPLLKEGLRGNWRCLYLGDPATVQMVDEALCSNGINTRREIERGALVLSSDRSHLVGGKFDPAAMVTGLCTSIDGAVHDGFAGLCATGDMRWELGADENFERLLEYEARLEQVFKDKPLNGICQYHRSLVPAAAVRDALLTHQAAYVGESLNRDNLFYIPPELLLHARDGLDPAKYGEWMCTQLLRVLDAERRRDQMMQALKESQVQQRRAEEQLRQAQKMDAIGRLAGGIAHDFNNLLSVILTFSELYLRDLPATAPGREDLEEIKKAGERAACLTRQLLAFSRQQVIDLQPLSLNAIVSNMDKMLRRVIGEDIRLETRAFPSLGFIKADAGQLEQVLMNLVVNARDAMPQGGRLTLETANVDLDETYAREHLGTIPGPHVMLAVSDTGTGMDKATQEQIFEPFFTTKETGKGTGLGLSTVFGIVKQLGGSVWVYSEPGKGSTFKVYLPRTDDEGARVAAPAPKPVRGNESILLVEDELAVREVAHRILTRAGYRVFAAQGPDDALKLAAEHPRAFDLILCDVVMPEVSGPALMKKLLEIRPGMPALFMSGYTDEAVVRHGALQEGAAFVQKPLTPEALTTKVREALASAPSRTAAGE